MAKFSYKLINKKDQIEEGIISAFSKNQAEEKH